MAKSRDLMGRLKEGPLLFDGGMGTQLFEQGLAAGACGVAWNADEPDKVQAIHEAYVKAGCDVITTNTFQGSREALSMHLLDDRAPELNEAGAKIARKAGKRDTIVAGDIGPFGGFLEPLGDTTQEELTDLFIEQMTALKNGGADCILIETMSDLNETRCAVAAAKKVADWPVVVSYAYQKSGDQFITMMGTLTAEVVNATFSAGADVVGANCGTSMNLEDYVRLADAMNDAAGGRPVILQPNAGAPVTGDDGQITYPATPKQMAKIVSRLLASGVNIIGGCCGTTPKHLEAMADAMKAEVEA